MKRSGGQQRSDRGTKTAKLVTVVVTDDDLEIPLEAQGISIFGANHCAGRRDSERLIAHGALTLYALLRQLGDKNFFALLRDWTQRYRHGTVVTDDFTDRAANFGDESLRPLWDRWLYSADVP